MQLFEQTILRLNRTKLSSLDAQMFEYLMDRRVTDVLDQLECAKPRERVRRFNDHTQKRQGILYVGPIRRT